MANTKAAIVAVPRPLDPIRLIGSEEKHATLLYFGDTTTLPSEAKQTLLDSVEMVCGFVFQVREEILNISRLGPEVPPALVAMTSRQSFAQIRSLLKMNPAIVEYLKNAEQFPSFTPHVTLGYPDYAEEVILRSLAQTLYMIEFDRLSVWWGDERFDFKLNGDKMWDADTDVAKVAHAFDKYLEEHLEHSGTKGMKWGVRRAVDPSTGLVKRTSSEDQIATDRVIKKIASGGSKSLSNAEIQAFTRRLQLQSDLDKSLATMSAADKAKVDGFVKKFIKSQSARQFDRVAAKAIDIAIEQAIGQAAKKSAGKNPELSKNLGELSKRLAPKKK